MRPNKVDDVKEALGRVSLPGMTVTEVRGHGKQKGHTAIYRGKEYDVSLLPKMQIEVVVPDNVVDDAVAAIIQAARTGEIGDGRVFVIPVEQSYRIRTGERASRHVLARISPLDSPRPACLRGGGRCCLLMRVAAAQRSRRRPSRSAAVPGRSREARSARHGGAVVGRQRLDARQRRAGPDDDRPRPGAVLRRARPSEEHAGDHDAELCADGARHRALGTRRLQPLLRGKGRRSSAGSVTRCCAASASDPNADYAATIPHQTFMVYQLMFAIITPALITGATAERMKFSGDGGLHDAVVALRVRAAGAHGVGQGRLR